MSSNTNPYLDQSRVDFLRARINSTDRKGLLSAWPRDGRELPVVEVEVAWVKFSTLNHRTRAEQLSQMIRTGQQNLFTEDPMGHTAQAAQYKILSSQSGFQELREDLKNRRQREHAVITADGVLINGNRRAAALRSLFEEANNLDCRYIRCLVLPADATPAELILLETELQVAKDFKQDYSWVNRALLIEELYNSNARSFEKVAAMMHRAVKDIREDFEKIQQVNQLVEMAKGEWLHIDFEANESAFDELAQYIRTKTESEKEAVRTVYFLGTLAGVNYRELRNLRRSDCKQLVDAEFNSDPQSFQLVQVAGGVDSLPQNGEDDLLASVLGEQLPVSTASKVLDMLVRQDRRQPVVFQDGTVVELPDVRAQVARVIEKAAAEAAEQKKDLSAVSAPLMRLEAAILNLHRARETLAQARALPGWNETKFLGLVVQAEEILTSLSGQKI